MHISTYLHLMRESLLYCMFYLFPPLLGRMCALPALGGQAAARRASVHLFTSLPPPTSSSGRDFLL